MAVFHCFSYWFGSVFVNARRHPAEDALAGAGPRVMGGFK